MGDNVPPVRGWRWWVAAALLTILAGVVAHVGLTRRIEDRLATGRPVSATVTGTKNLPLGKLSQWRRFTVAYDFHGLRSVRVNDAFGDGDFAVGDRVTLYVDPAHPDRVALAGNLGSEGLILFLPPAVVVWAIVGLIALLGKRIRWWRRFSRGRPVDVPLLKTVTIFESVEARHWRSAGDTLSRVVAAAPSGRRGLCACLSTCASEHAAARGRHGIGARVGNWWSWCQYQIAPQNGRKHSRTPFTAVYKSRKDGADDVYDHLTSRR